MNFFCKHGPALDGDLIYRKDEFSIDFVQKKTNTSEKTYRTDVSSISIGTLQLEVSMKYGEVLFPWGYFPFARWINRSLTPPIASSGRLFISDAATLLAGGTTSLPDSTSWSTYIDCSSGWLNIGGEAPGEFAIEFATNVVASLIGERLVGLWLKPKWINV